MTEATEEDAKLTYFDVCPYGDMEIALITSTTDITYRVSSHQLSSGSSVFRAMLGPQSSFSEANGLRRHQMSFPTAVDSKRSLFQITTEEEHNPTALATVLYALHGRAEYIPESVSFENLLEIAIICDYYDCAATMRPWDEIWMSPLRNLTSEPGYESWLFIAWVFGDQSAFGEMTASFSTSAVMVDGELGINVDGKVKRLDCRLPQGIIDAIADQRVKIGQEIVHTFRGFYTKYEKDNPVKCTYGVKACDYIIFAALHKSFKSINLFDAGEGFQEDLELNAIVQTTKSVMCAGLASVLQNLRVGHRIHSSCYDNLSVIQNLESILQHIRPLHLTSFSRKPDTRPQWERFMEEEGTFRRTIRRTDTDFFHLDICKYGDMEIVLTANTIHAMYTVSSHQLRAGSPIFRDLLCQGSAFQEHTRLNHEQTPESGLNTDNTNRATRYQLQVSKDFDPTAFSIVLCILHARGQNLPESIHFDHLISIVAICDHYHCSALLKPWHGKWVDSWKESAKSPGYENWLFAAWVIGEDNIFQILTKKFAHQGVLSNNKFVIVVENEQERDVKYLTKFTPKVLIGINQQVPQDDTLRNTYADTLVIYIDAILEQRNAAEEKIIQACRDIYEKYSNDTTTNCRTAPHSIAGKLCDRYIFGELHLRFKAGRLLQADVFSIPSGISLNRVVAVLDKLSKATISDLKDARMQGYYHNACAVDITGLATTAQAAVNDIKSLRLATFGRK